VPLANRLLNSTIAIWIGKISYSLYVWHGAVIFLFVGLLSQYLPENLVSWSLLLLSFVVAALSYHLVEVPFSKLRHYFTSRGAPDDQKRSDGSRIEFT
jgi:peptidoglycan/LPS O-acetylase OafA/YrhL